MATTDGFDPALHEGPSYLVPEAGDCGSSTMQDRRWGVGPTGRWGAGPMGRRADRAPGRWGAGPIGRRADGAPGRWGAGPSCR
jgi:hypothetical protein